MEAKAITKNPGVLTGHQEVGPCGRCESEEEATESDHNDEGRRGSGQRKWVDRRLPEGWYRRRGMKIQTLRLVPLYMVWVIQGPLHLNKQALYNIGVLPIALETFMALSVRVTGLSPLCRW